MRAVGAVARRVSGPPVVRVHVEWIRLPRRRTVNSDRIVFLRLPLQELPEGKSFANAMGARSRSQGNGNEKEDRQEDEPIAEEGREARGQAIAEEVSGQKAGAVAQEEASSQDEEQEVEILPGRRPKPTGRIGYDEKGRLAAGRAGLIFCASWQRLDQPNV